MHPFYTAPALFCTQMLEAKKQQVAMTQDAMSAIQAQYDAVMSDLTSTREEKEAAAEEAERMHNSLCEQV